MLSVALLAMMLAALVFLQVRRDRQGTLAVSPPVPLMAPSRENVAPGFSREVAALEHRLSVSGSDTAALLRLARLHHDAHQPDLAAGYYERYLALAPADRQAWLDLAAVRAAQADWAGALAATDTLLARDSLDAAASYNRGAIHASRGETEAARRWWQRAARQATDSAVAARAAEALRRLGALS